MTARSELTRNQSLVLATLRKADGALSAYSVLDRLREEGFRAPLQVYRALTRLQELHLVHKLESINAFIACADPHDHDEDHGLTAFAICEDCGNVDEFADAVVEERLGQWARQHAFHPAHTTIEMRGRCASCAGSN